MDGYLLKKLWILLPALVIVFFILYYSNYLGKPTYNQGLAPIKIGLVGPWTGPLAVPGASMREGAELAVENINRNGGINSRQVVLIEYDDRGLPSECYKAVKRLIDQDEVVAIIGPYSSVNTLAVKDLVNEKHMPLITPVAMADEIKTRDDFVFRNTLGISAANEKMQAFVDDGAATIFETMGCKTIGIMWQNDFWGEKMSKAVVDSYVALNKGNEVLFSQPYDLGRTDFVPQLRGLLPKKPDIIYLVSLTNEAIPIVRQARELGYHGLFLGEGGFNTGEFDRELKERANGCLFSTQWHPSFSTPMSDVFVKLYSDKYQDKEPDMFSAITYEATYIVKSAIDTVGNRSADIADWRLAVRAAMARTRNFDGVSGRISFNNIGQCDRPLFMLQKRWDGRRVTAVIIFPQQYAQDRIRLDLGFSQKQL
jgi:branched-chain amino acid transport system substrate-binding protein